MVSLNNSKGVSLCLYHRHVILMCNTRILRYKKLMGSIMFISLAPRFCLDRAKKGSNKFPYTRVLASTRCCWWWCADQNSVMRLWKHHHLSRYVPTPPESLFKLLRHRFTHLINWLKFCEILPAARGQCPNVPILCQYSHFAGFQNILTCIENWCLTLGKPSIWVYVCNYRILKLNVK